MQVERTRLDVAAMNIANVNTTRTVDGGMYSPLSVVTTAKSTFSHSLDTLGMRLATPEANVVQQNMSVPRLVHEPNHPDANEDGFVAYPGVDTVKEMINIMTAVRAYEANVVAINAAKSMALKAIDLGSGA